MPGLAVDQSQLISQRPRHIFLCASCVVQEREQDAGSGSRGEVRPSRERPGLASWHIEVASISAVDKTTYS